MLLGRAQALLDILGELGDISTELQEKIKTETDEEKLKMWLKMAVKAESIEELLKIITND